MRPLGAVVVAAGLALLAPACRGCNSGPGGDTDSGPSGAAAAAGSAEPALVIPSALPARGTVPPAVAREHRTEVLAAIDRARALVAEHRAREALVALAQATALDPTGAALALELARTATAADDPRRARDWAERARVRASGNLALRAAAGAVLGAMDAPPGPAAASGAGVRGEGAGAPSAVPARGGALEADLDPDPALVSEATGPYPGLEPACAALVDQVRQGKSPALGLARAEVRGVECRVGAEHPVGAAGLAGAAELRLRIREAGRTEASWVAVRTPQGILALGPLVRVHTPAPHPLDNAYALRLDHLDVLPGGAPEVAVGIDERRTTVDVALNEVLALDRTRVVVVTVDRGRLRGAAPITTFELAGVELADPSDEVAAPAGYAPSPLLHRPTTRRFRLSWGENEVVLTSTTNPDGSASPRRLRLFE